MLLSLGTKIKFWLQAFIWERGEIMAVKKGNMVRAIREKLENSLEAKASDSRFPSYLFETQGEIVDIKGTKEVSIKRTFNNEK